MIRLLRALVRALGRPSVLGALALVAATAPASAQDTFRVTGTVTDSTGAGLERAMVVALALPDSTLAAFATSGSEGSFTLERVAPGDYLLQVQLASFETVRTPFTVTDADVDVGAQPIALQVYGIEPLVVSVDHTPFQNRRDTLTFNAAAFETRPNASVEDLLRRMPGFEVDSDGNIEVQGEAIEQVLVEGKEFFGTDPTVATRGLPADAVAHVEVYDRESDMAEFTGIPDGEERKTLNLRLTEEAQRGWFGSAEGALGASEAVPSTLTLADDEVRFDQQLGINRFTPSSQLALIGSLNNVGRARFNVGGAGGRGGQVAARGGGGGGGGFTSSGVLGFSGSHDFTDDDWIRGSYFFSDLTSQSETSRLQQQLLGSSVASTISNDATRVSDTQSHRVDLNAQRDFSEGNRLRLRAGLNANQSSSTDLSTRLTASAGGDAINSEVSSTGTDSDNLSGNANLTWMKRLGDAGRSLVVNLGANLSRPESSGDLISTLEVATPDGPVTTELLQDRLQTGRVFTNTQRVALTQSLGDTRTLEIFGERRDVREDEERSVFDITDDESVLVDDLSSGLEQTYGYLSGGFRLNRNTESSRFVLGLEAQRSNLEGTIDGRSETIENSNTRLLPSADLRLQVGDSHSLDFGYRTSTSEPTMEQLQPFADNSSPTNVYIGNPDLQPQFTQALNANWRFFDAFTFLSVSSFARFSHTTDDIVTSRTIDERGFQTAQPVNGGNSWSATSGLNVGRPIRTLGTNVSVDYRLNLTKRPEFVNGEENRSRILGNTVSLQLSNRDKSRFDIEADARFAFNDVAYSLNDELDQGYMNSTYSLRGTLYLGDAWSLSGDWAHQRYDEEVFGDAENLSLLDLSISRYLFDERASIELAAYDLFDESQVVSLSSSADAITESRSQAMGRYLMLRFNYRLGTLGRGGAGGGRGGFGGR